MQPKKKSYTLNIYSMESELRVDEIVTGNIYETDAINKALKIVDTANALGTHYKVFITRTATNKQVCVVTPEEIDLM